MWVTHAEEPPPPAQGVGTEQEEDGRQRQQAIDRAAVLQDELIRAADRERQLQTRLDKMKDDLAHFHNWMEQRADLQKDFDNYKWEQEIKRRDSRFSVL